MGKFKGACKKAWTGTKRFFKENWQSILVVGGQIGVTAGIGYGLYKLSGIGKNKQEEPAMLESSDYQENLYDWNEEEYRENFDKVKNLVKDLKLKPGESFYIDDPSQFAGCEEMTEPILSHLVYGYGVYPPDTSEES